MNMPEGITVSVNFAKTGRAGFNAWKRSVHYCGKTYRVFGAEPPSIPAHVEYAPPPMVHSLRHACGAEITIVSDKPQIEFYGQGPDGEFNPSDEYFFDLPVPPE